VEANEPLHEVTFYEYYDEMVRMMSDLGKLIRYNLKLLVETGSRHIQFDGPLFTMSNDKGVEAAVDAINLANNHRDLPRYVAFGNLRAMSADKRILGG
jgi:methionine synthase II (cobalamin-independent)